MEQLPNTIQIHATLSRLSEELGEVLQFVGKSQRFGINSTHPSHPNGETNIGGILREMKDVMDTLELLIAQVQKENNDR